MKSFIMLLFITFFCQNTNAQYFSVKKIRSEKKNLYKIKEKGDKSDIGNYSYPIYLKSRTYTNKDTLAMIDELLKYEGDTRICILPIKSYNPMTSQIYMGQTKSYSLQIEALFIINQLYFHEPFNYSPFPVLYDCDKKKIVSNNENVIAKAYYNYKEWFKRIKEIGIDEARGKKLEPLDNKSIKWYR